MEAAQTHSAELGAAPACRAFGVPRASFYRHRQRRAEPAPDPIRRRSHRALSEVERQEVLDLLHGDRFVDMSMTRSRILVERALARRAFDLNFQCRTGGMSVQTSLSVIPFGFKAALCPP